MTDGELLAALNSSGIRFAYHHWPEKDAPPPPYGVYLLNNETAFYADGEMYFRSAQYQAELYTAKKTPEAERKVEKALLSAGLSFTKTEVYIDSEKLYKTTYEIEV